jgi:hypothetical protein
VRVGLSRRPRRGGDKCHSLGGEGTRRPTIRRYALVYFVVTSYCLMSG